MKQVIDDIKKQTKEIEKNTFNAYELAISTMEQNYKREKFVTKCLMIIIVILLAINGFLAYQFATATVLETSYKQEGDYNAINENGAMTNGDYYNSTETV